MLPSLRWLGVCLAAWVVLGAVGWAPAQGSIVRAARTVWPTAALAVFLPWAYLDDQVFHALTRAAVQTLGSLGGLALLGAVRQFSRPLQPHASVPPAQTRIASPVLAATLAGMCLMSGLNDVLFEPLGVPPGGPLAPLRLLAVALPAAAFALAVRARLVAPLEAGALSAVAGGTAFLAVWLGVAPPGPPLFAIALAGLVIVARDEYWLALAPRVRGLAVGTVVLGVALASTDVVKFGLGARELIAETSEPARLLPAIGLLAVAGALALGAVAQTSRSAAMGGTRDA